MPCRHAASSYSAARGWPCGPPPSPKVRPSAATSAQWHSSGKVLDRIAEARVAQVETGQRLPFVVAHMVDMARWAPPRSACGAARQGCPRAGSGPVPPKARAGSPSSSLARREIRAHGQLRTAFGIHEQAVFFGIAGAGQDQVGAMRAAVAMAALIDHEGAAIFGPGAMSTSSAPRL